MKQCSTCQEEFADKFSFCPVDGTPLNGFAARQADTPSAAPADSDSEETVPSTPAVPEGYHFNASDNEDEVDAEIPESVGASAAAAGAADDGEYHLTIMDDAGLVSRLTAELREVAHESQLTWPEFKRDPFGFTKTLVQSLRQDGRWLLLAAQCRHRFDDRAGLYDCAGGRRRLD
jgi:hypothetical protein